MHILNLNTQSLIHSLIFYTPLSIAGCRKAEANLTSGARWGTPWTGRQSITEPTLRQTNIYTHIHIGNLENFKVQLLLVAQVEEHLVLSLVEACKGLDNLTEWGSCMVVSNSS